MSKKIFINASELAIITGHNRFNYLSDYVIKLYERYFNDDYKRIQKGLDEYGFKRKSEMEVVKDFTFIEHFIFALCSKRGSFSGKMKYTSRNFEGANKKTEVEKSKLRAERRKEGSAYKKATRALKGETEEFGFTNRKALMDNAKVGKKKDTVGGRALRESSGIGAATVGKAGELLSNIGDRTGCFFKRFVTINGKKEEICGEKRALTDEEVKALEKAKAEQEKFKRRANLDRATIQDLQYNAADYSGTMFDSSKGHLKFRARSKVLGKSKEGKLGKFRKEQTEDMAGFKNLNLKLGDKEYKINSYEDLRLYKVTKRFKFIVRA